MSLPLKTGFPPEITVSSSYIIRFRATDPTTGADVAGVKISGASVFSDLGDSLSLTPIDLPGILLLPQPEFSGTQIPHA